MTNPNFTQEKVQDEFFPFFFLGTTTRYQPVYGWYKCSGLVLGHDLKNFLLVQSQQHKPPFVDLVLERDLP